MSLLSANRVKFFRAAMIFEQLEERIVLDASVDQTIHQNACGCTPHPILPPPLPFEAPPPAVLGHVPPAAQAQVHPNELNVVLIADNLPQKEMLQAAAQDHAQVLFYDASSSLNAINTALKQLVNDSGHKIDHLAVVGHAELGKAWLGAEKVDVLSAQSHRPDFEALGQVLADDAQVQLYGCSIAGNALGEALVDRIALYSHADVFASADKTGGTQHDWVLEYASNPDQKMLPILQADVLNGYTSELDVAVNSFPIGNYTPGGTVFNLGFVFTVTQTPVPFPDPPGPEVQATVYVPVLGGFNTISVMALAGATVNQVSDTQIDITADSGDALNLVLGSLSGTIPVGYIGDLGLVLAVTDLTPDADSGASFGTIIGTNDVPVVTVPATTQVVPANTLTILSGITVDDGDAPDIAPVGDLEVTITAADATTQLTVPTVSLTSVAGLGTNILVIRGLDNNITTALESLGYFNTAPGPDTLTIVANDLGQLGAGGPQQTQATVNINVQSAFQDFTPSIGGIGVGPFAIAGGAPQTLQTIDGLTPITVADPNSHIIDVGIHTNHGTLALPVPLNAEITVTGTDPSNHWVQFRGPLDYVQDTVRATTYTAPTHYTGQDFIYILADDVRSSDYRSPVNRPTQLTMPLNVANP